MLANKGRLYSDCNTVAVICYPNNEYSYPTDNKWWSSFWLQTFTVAVRLPPKKATLKVHWTRTPYTWLSTWRGTGGSPWWTSGKTMSHIGRAWTVAWITLIVELISEIPIWEILIFIAAWGIARHIAARTALTNWSTISHITYMIDNINNNK